MHIIARLEEATLRSLLDEVLPITILLDENDSDRWVAIEPTQHVDFVAGLGVRLITGGRLRWGAAGVPFEATFHSAQVLLRPELVPEKHGGQLVFHPSLEAVDLKNVPGFIDRGIVALVNRQLESRSPDMTWDIGRTLALSTPLPPTLVGLSALQLGVTNAVVTVSADAIELGITISLHFQRSPAV